MRKIMKLAKRFVREDDGLETVEYAIISGLIVVGTIGAITAIGQWVAAQYQALQSALGA
jgi:Flp pilus assembly pilin Flp